MDNDTNIEQLKQLAARFRDERDWSQFHNPKDLAISISIEANELLELFQWKTKEEIDLLLKDPAKREEVREEIADIVVYCLSLCEPLGIDLSEAVMDKIKKNEAKYPVDKAKGSAKKYTELANE